MHNFSFDRSNYFSDVNYTNYYWFSQGFSPEELERIESQTSTIDFEKAATGQDKSSKISQYRKSQIKWCPQTDEWHWVYEKLHNMIYEANEVMWKMNITHMREQIQYTEYYEGGGHYDWHMDCGIGIQNQRKLSVTVQLSDSDEYEGGDLQFNLGGDPKTGQRGKGNVIIFPSFYLHRVTPVTKGTRKSFVLWVGGEPYR